jgi:hypothetical protein
MSLNGTNGTKRYQTAPNNIKWCLGWMAQNCAERYWTGLNSTKQDQTAPNNIKWCLDQKALNWIERPFNGLWTAVLSWTVWTLLNPQMKKLSCLKKLLWLKKIIVKERFVMSRCPFLKISSLQISESPNIFSLLSESLSSSLWISYLFSLLWEWNLFSPNLFSLISSLFSLNRISSLRISSLLSLLSSLQMESLLSESLLSSLFSLLSSLGISSPLLS